MTFDYFLNTTSQDRPRLVDETGPATAARRRGRRYWKIQLAASITATPPMSVR